MNPLGLAPFGAHRPPHDPRRLAESILAQPRFRMRVSAPVRRTWWDALTGWLGDRWHQLLHSFARSVHISPSAGMAFGDLLIAVAAGVVVVAVIRLLARYAPEHVAVLLPIERGGARRADAQTLYERALQAARSGDHRAAIALLFRAALAALDLHGIVRDEASFTVNECRASVRRAEPHLAATFDDLARVFSAALYAEAKVTSEQFVSARDACGAIMRESGDAI